MQQNKKKSYRVLAAAMMSLVLVAGLAAGCGKKEETPPATPAPGTEAPATTPAATGNPEDVLITYKDGSVKRAEFDKFVDINMLFYPQYAQFKTDPAFQQDIMNQLLAFKILGARADAATKADAEKQAKEQMEQIKMYLGMQEGGLEKALKDNNVTEQEIQNFIGSSLTAIVGAEKQVTDDEVKKAYDSKLAQDANIYTVATVRHILVGTTDAATGAETRSKEDALKRAKEVQDKLKAGGDFDALAKEYSDDPGSKEAGGKYENAEVSQWVPEFKKAAIELPLNQISDPVETTYGYHVMKVESRSTKTFDETKEALRSEAAQGKIYEFLEKELPGMIQTNNMPKVEAPAAEAPAAEAPKTEEKK
ncbi:foldase protein PrsA [Paenibacillus sp. UNCCL117]|uniref:peptidylprolyl isomerase n=1 Tax=unclassified Paenibacillus TaxID=185978 RepID=UPI00087F1249|nr:MULTISPECIES: peptidylprolyl isomerase [unclassified Paenibacillus]SDE53732.1 foldase protein PrsA [Paenibacillus sp. cl123]SFW68075.1 foldase protein PrsA [Paenibacillus sp. UNCCL117]